MKKIVYLIFTIFFVNITYSQNYLFSNPELLEKDVYNFYKIDTITLGTPYSYYFLYLESQKSGECFQVFMQDEEPDKDMKKLIRRGKLNKLEIGKSYELQLLRTGMMYPMRVERSPYEDTYWLRLYEDTETIFLPIRLSVGLDYYVISNSWGFYVYDPDESYGRDIESVYMFPKPLPDYPVRVERVETFSHPQPRVYERNMPPKKE